MRIIYCIMLICLLTGCSSVDERNVRIFSLNQVDLVLQLRGRAISVSEGTIKISGRTTPVASTHFDIPASAVVDFKDEPFELIRPTEENSVVWQRTPIGTRVCGLPLPNLIVPGSLRVKSLERARSGNHLTSDDYSFDSKWGVILASENATQCSERVLLDYSVRQQRICTLVSDQKGKISLLLGPLSRGAPSPPAVSANMVAIANILAPAFNEDLSVQDVMPIQFADSLSIDAHMAPNREQKWRPRNGSSNYLAKAIEKLEHGKSFSIHFIGDSVTGGCCSSTPEKSFPRVTIEILRKQYPHCRISFTVFAKAGTNSSTQLESYLHDLALSQPTNKPDLVVVEFVNDLSLNRNEVEKIYGPFVDELRRRGSDVLVCLPHLVNPTFYGLKPGEWQVIANKVFYAAVIELSQRQKFAVANIARRYLFAKNEGLRPELLLADNANHPNDRGHAIYAEELANCLIPTRSAQGL